MDGLVFHHVGVACRDLDADGAIFEELGFVREGDDFVDPVQGVRGRFLVAAGFRIELLAEIEGSAVLRPWLAGGARLYHQAYEATDLDASLAALIASGAKVARAPVGAVAFGGHRIAFAMLPNLMLVELVEAGGRRS